MDSKQPQRSIKHKTIYDKICSDILKGVYKPGQKLPTENELAEFFKTSRPTISRAMRDIQEKGLIVRHQGQGTFVKQAAVHEHKTFGILVHWQIRPHTDTMTTIFGVMVPEILKVASQHGYSLLLNDIPEYKDTDYIEYSKKIAQRLIDSHVAGVFFTPLEVSDKMSINEELANAFDKAGIALVLLDRDISDSYHRSKYDIVGINNEQSSLVLTNHLLKLGCRKIDFVCGPALTTAINDRMRGFRAAMEEQGLHVQPRQFHSFDSKRLLEGNCIEGQNILELVKSGKTEAFVCVNDSTAADVMLYCLRHGLKVPQDVRIVGFDDLPMNKLLPVPLTTIRQPAEALAHESVRTMIDRIEHSQTPARDIMVKTELIIRQSCGSK
ncbi:GntR family transcriptional regulator [Anaerohalosphaeraceae bacterium U12dextr]